MKEAIQAQPLQNMIMMTVAMVTVSYHYYYAYAFSKTTKAS
jgi:hypothetical protein